jgi:hypothetical protein
MKCTRRRQRLADIGDASTEGEGGHRSVSKPRRSDIPAEAVAKRLSDLADVDRATA